MADPQRTSGYIEDGRYYEVPIPDQSVYVAGPPIQAIPVTPGQTTPSPALPAEPRPARWPKLLLAFVAVLVIAAAGGLAYVLLRPNASAATETAQITACREKVKAQLKAPATAQFSNEAVTKQPTGELFEVNGAVDAQNGFGALLRQRYRCTVTGGGQALAVTLSEWS